MNFLKKMGETFLKPHSDISQTKTDVLEKFDEVDEEKDLQKGMSLLSFYRQRCIRGNIRSFQIFLDGGMAAKIDMEKQCHLLCEPGFHKVYIKLDTMKSQILNVKTEPDTRYFFEIACTMEEGLILRQLEWKSRETEEA